VLVVGSHGFRAEGVGLACGILQRWRGLMGAEPRPLLVRATSVHGFWLRAPLVVVALDASGRVIAAVRLERRRVVTVP